MATDSSRVEAMNMCANWRKRSANPLTTATRTSTSFFPSHLRKYNAQKSNSRPSGPVMILLTWLLAAELLLLTLHSFHVQAQQTQFKATSGSVSPTSLSTPSLSASSSSALSGSVISDEFSPLVTAHCDRGIMHVNIVTQQPFWGVAHTRDHRKSAPCLVAGAGATNTTLKISLLAAPGDELYCGVQRFKGERSVSLAVRPHKSLELSEDRFFFLTCHTGYKNVKGGTYRVNLRLIDERGERVNRLVHGSPYSLRAELTPKDSITTLRMKNCFVFARSTDHVELIDRSGCPAASGLVSAFTYNDSASGEAQIPAMFRFADDAKVHFQCDALLCRENCDEPDCEGTSKAREFELDRYSQVSASTSVFIREPTDSDALESADGSQKAECTEWRFPWLITLCICLAIMLLVMLLLNLFMCSSMTCRCIKTEANEKEPESDFGDYDPYRADWTAPNSLHGSRYSLEQGRGARPGGGHHSGYTSTDDTHSDDDRRSANHKGQPGPYHHNSGYVPDRPSARSTAQPQGDHARRHWSSDDSDDSDGDERTARSRPIRPDSRASSSARPIRERQIDYSNSAYPYTAQRY